MPRTALPPTPASSTDIHGKDGTKQLSSLQTSLELPEPAINNQVPAGRSHSAVRISPESPVSTTSPKAPYPIQPAEAVKSRRRSSATTATTAATTATTATTTTSKDNNNNAFALPPPPTRSRKIIQMKPRLSQDEKKQPVAEPAPAAATTTSGKAPGRRNVAAATAPSAGEAGPPSKKKQPSATSAAGRKIARKTAHSLIERRRRSKMNEEFAVLKDMIPACTGEMHKLAILQASIEYVRYLQNCIEQLQSRDPQTPMEQDHMASSFRPQPYNSEEPPHSHQHSHDEEDDSPDVEMANSDITPSPTFTTRPSSSNTLAHNQSSSSHQASVSPALVPQDSAVRRHDSYASISTAVEHHRHYSYSSATTSPAIGPGWSAGGYVPSNPGSTLTSPALGPLMERDLDQEATAALLMLNSDRRGTVRTVAGSEGLNTSASTSANASASASGRGMSVRDLLSA